MPRRISPEQCRAARAWLDWPQAQLAAMSSVSQSTIRDLEAGKRTTHPLIQAAVREAFEKAGVEFVPHGLIVKPTKNNKKR